MRIIGGHDYYDGAGMGVDTRTVFTRNVEPDPVLVPDLTLPSDYVDGFSDYKLRHVIVLIGGETWPVLERSLQRGSGLNYRIDMKLTNDAGEARAMIRTYHDRRKSRDSFMRRERDNESLDFLSTPRDYMTGWAIRNEAVVAVIRTDNSRHKRKTEAFINCTGLSEMGFARIVDPATAHMRISNFVSGVLPHSKPIVELSDNDRIAKAGFDARSFRKDPGQKKRRRRVG